MKTLKNITKDAINVIALASSGMLMWVAANTYLKLAWEVMIRIWKA